MLLKKRAIDNPKNKGSKAKQRLQRFLDSLLVKFIELLKTTLTKSATNMTPINIAARLKPFREYSKDKIIDISMKKEKLSSELNAILAPSVL